MITEPEMSDNPDNHWDANTPTNTVSTEPTSRHKPPWTWALGTAIATSAAWALTLHLTSCGDARAPDLHHYQLTEKLCSTTALKPLTDAFHTSQSAITPPSLLSGKALDQVTCELATPPVHNGDWQASYRTTVTVELHKKTDPAPEFHERNSQDLRLGLPDRVETVTPVHGLGDEAYLVTDGQGKTTITVRHGGAVFTIDVTANAAWTDTGTLPSKDDQDFRLTLLKKSRHLQPALTATVRSLMSTASH